MLVKAIRFHIVHKHLLDDSDTSLFKAVPSCSHCLHYLFAARPEHTHSMVLRPRGHNFCTFPIKSEIAKNIFR